MSDNVKDLGPAAEDYLRQFGRNLNVSAMQKLTKWPFLQQLGYNGQLSHVTKDFHGLQDFKKQLDMYSMTHWILTAAWSVIKNLVPSNAEITRTLFSAPGLGQVGSLFKSINGFGQVFGVSLDELKNQGTVVNKATQFAQQAKNSTSDTSGTTGSGVGGAGISSVQNAHQINGIQVAGTPTANQTLVYDGVSLKWQAGGGVSDDKVEA